ncbi:hypothetical protein [Vibrio sp. LaRot3]|uniref:hypothetical protein n=1 Tax=Vibrio sp. LaRot3 TaxID=2998829 RepID=UPI0022CE0389|nr:hypothetical protein [Vibrio sp. LaRot3]MDA0148934.1 hypothetical protein [Vibrio sp. LaRot3]
MAKKNKSRANKTKKTGNPSRAPQKAANKKEKKPIKWKRIFTGAAVFAAFFFAINWYNSPTNYVFRMGLWDLVHDEVRYDRPGDYFRMVEEGEIDDLYERISSVIKNNGMSDEMTLNELFKDHPKITDFAVREIETFRDIDGELKPVTVVSITFNEKDRYMFRLLEFSMYNPYYIPLPFHYEMVSAAGVRSYKDEEGELHVRRNISPFEIISDFYNDDFATEGYLALPEQDPQQ